MDRSCEKEEVSQDIKHDRNILQTIKERKANWICHILRTNCLLKYVTNLKKYGRTGVTRKRGKRDKQIPDDLNTLRTGLLNCLNARSRGLIQSEVRFL